MKKVFSYFSLGELALWIGSLAFITVTFLVFSDKSYISLICSLIGATALIFCARGNPIGQALIIIFAILYGIISYSCAYYGEMITYLGMSAPMAVFALISWIKNPYNNNKSEVKVNHIKNKELVFAALLSIVVTVVFYFILKALGTANLITSTISVTTSFFAVYLSARRSPYYALAYALNDVVLIILWLFATIVDTSYISTLCCFVVFLANDIHGFISWRKMEKRQSAT